MIGSGAAMIWRRWPAGFLRAARIGILVLAVCSLDRSSEQYEQKAHKQESTATMPLYIETGKASWYGSEFQGLETASGEIFDQKKMTAAHPTLPLGTKVEVTNLEKNKTAEVIITDRGPYAKGRVIDLSNAAAKKLGMEKKGTAKVRIKTKTVKKKSSKKKRFAKKISKRKMISKKHRSYRSRTRK